MAPALSAVTAPTAGAPEAPAQRRLDEDHQSFGQHAVIRHGLDPRLGLHEGHDGFHRDNVHEHLPYGTGRSRPLVA
jgi:hypothetical protein